MNKLIKLSFVITAIGLVFCLGGCNKSESEYKSAISEHMKSEHRVLSIDSYNYFRINDDGSAKADVNVTVATVGNGIMGMRNELTVDKDCKISSCGWCALGL